VLNEKIKKIILSEYELHPQATLIDYYKLFFQGSFGPGHFIESEEKARNFLQKELASATSFENHLYQDVSFLGKFYRINLAIIKYQLVSFEDFFEGFIKSSQAAPNLSYDEWLNHWQQIESILKKSSVKITDFDEASHHLSELFEQKNYLVSHSIIYRKKYNPHYRLFSERQFNKLNIEKMLPVF
jgi:hypothetical protein